VLSINKCDYDFYSSVKLTISGQQCGQVDSSQSCGVWEQYDCPTGTVGDSIQLERYHSDIGRSFKFCGIKVYTDNSKDVSEYDTNDDDN